MKFLIADDHALFRAGVRQLIVRAIPGATLLECATAAATRAAVLEHPDLDLVLLDLALPDGDGLAVMKALGEGSPGVPIAILSASEDVQAMQTALKCGASGFIPKAASEELILAAIRLILGGGIYVPPQLLDAKPAAKGSADLDALTPRQREVLGLLAEGQSNKEIADALGLTEATVKQHVSAILKALNVSNRVQAVLLARSVK